jgi:amino acid transporter
MRRRRTVGVKPTEVKTAPPETNGLKKIGRKLFGPPRNIKDPTLFHKLSLVPLLAWIGLGADGLSSSSYGPEEAFRTLGGHTYLAVFLALATALTVFIISSAYSKIIEHFPSGGGGYIVATHTLGNRAGVVSGSALLVDYILTITVSIASCGDALFSFLPLSSHRFKLPVEMLLILVLIVLNIRGVKESIQVLAPIFVVFILTHVFLIGYGILSHVPDIGPVAAGIHRDFKVGLGTLGWLGMLGLLLKAYSMGGGTYTGIEAVSNGLQVMREPRVQSGKRTMLYMASSLAFTAGGLFFCYLLLGVAPASGRTLNSILAGALFGQWRIGPALALITILSEGALLFVAAQAGFTDGPRVMANMAIDSWFPHRFASLSERLTMRNGVLLMGGASLLVLAYTRGNIVMLVVMYSINVFLTFSLSNLGMSRYFLRNRKKDPTWKRSLPVNLVGLVLCVTILVITSVEKFRFGGWLTLVITILVIALCHSIRRHYLKVSKAKEQLDEILMAIPTSGRPNRQPVDPKDMTAILLVRDFDGFGIHTLLSIIHNFPDMYKNFIFISVAVADSGVFKGSEGIKSLEANVREKLKRYIQLARNLGLRADFRIGVGTDVVETGTQLCRDTAAEFPKSTVFAGKITFPEEKFFHRILHNETAFAIQRNLHWSGVPAVILPIRVEI